MIDSVLSALNSPYIVYPAIVISGALITYKVLQVALPIIADFGRAIYNSTFVLNLRSMVCNECAKIHLTHLFKRNVDTKGKPEDTVSIKPEIVSSEKPAEVLPVVYGSPKANKRVTKLVNEDLSDIDEKFVMNTSNATLETKPLVDSLLIP